MSEETNNIPLPIPARRNGEDVFQEILEELALTYPHDIPNVLAFSRKIGVSRSTIIRFKQQILANWDKYGPQVLEIKRRHEQAAQSTDESVAS